LWQRSFVSGIQKIEDEKGIMALIVRSSFNEAGIHFFTPSEYSQQIAYMRHPSGKHIQAHVHNSVPREVQYTQETLFIRKGKIRVDFFKDDKSYVVSTIISTGDAILLVRGGHGFECLEETEMLEVKQGPYAGESDKSRFSFKVESPVITYDSHSVS